MAYDAAFGDWVLEHLAGLGSLRIGRMFGAAGLYADDRMFAILDDGVIWLQADADLAAQLTAEGARQFTYPTKDGQTMTMGYWSMPESALDDPEEAVAWSRRSMDVAAHKSAQRRPRKPKLTP